MQRSRFVFVQTRLSTVDGVQPKEHVLWLLISSNNRRLGQDVAGRETYAECHAVVSRLQDGSSRLATHAAIDPRDGRWTWRLSLDGVAVATASRSYLRTRECDYNVRRFLDALVTADVVPGVRRVVGGRRQRDREPPVAVRHVGSVRRWSAS